MKAQDITQAAIVVNKLQTLLTWDLACLQANANNAPFTVHITMQTNGPRIQPSLWLTTLDLEPLINSHIESAITTLEAAGINIDDIISQYKTLGVSLTQGDKKPLDNPSSL